MIEKINYKNFLTKTNLAIALFGILPSAGYLIGISFYQGRLSAYGISSDTLPLSIQDIYVEAFWAVGLWPLSLTTGIVGIFKKLVTPPGLYWFVTTILVITLTIYVLIRHKPFIRLFLREKLQPIKKVIDYLDWDKNSFTKAVGITGGFSYLLLSISWLIATISVCWIGLPLMAYNKGLDSATTTINSYLEKGCYVKDGERWSNCKKLITSDERQIYEGILVAHTNGYVAFFNKTGSYVAKFPEQAVITNTLHK